MFKLILVAAIVSIACRVIFGQWPWAYVKAPPSRGQAIIRARSLLSVGVDADRAEINAAHKRLVATVHPDRGGSNAQVHEANAARDLLIGELPQNE